MLFYDLLHPPGEVGLEGMIVLDIVRMHPRLNMGIRIPVLAVYLVAADMKVSIRKKRLHLTENGIDQLVCRVARRVQRRTQVVTLRPDQAMRCGTGRQLRISNQPAHGVARHIELRDNAHATVARIGDQCAHLILRIEKPVRA